MLITILAFVVALGIIITFHEYGHYWAAKRCGVRVLKFSVGFGKPIWRRVDQRGTEWAVASIPLGGYVKMLEEPEAGLPMDRQREAFGAQPVWNRFFIVVAGPVANFILAAIIYAGLGMLGTEEPAALLAQPAAGTPAAMAGIERGDQIVAVDSAPVASWNQVRWQMLDRLIEGGRVDLMIERYGRPIQKELVLQANGDNPDADTLGLAGLQLDTGVTRVTTVQPDSAADAAGLAPGDLLLAINQTPLVTRDLVEIVKVNAGKPLDFTVERDGVQMTAKVVPQSVTLDDGSTVGRIGVGFMADVPMVTVEHGFLQSTWLGVTRTAETAWFSLKMLGNMITGVVSWKNISGPVTIADYAGQTAQMGLTAYLAFLALVSVSIGVLNLLPIPMLDGGHLMYYLVEMVRGKPASVKWLEMGQRVGVVVLGSLMTLAIFNDLVRLFS